MCALNQSLLANYQLDQYEEKQHFIKRNQGKPGYREGYKIFLDRKTQYWEDVSSLQINP